MRSSVYFLSKSMLSLLVFLGDGDVALLSFEVVNTGLGRVKIHQQLLVNRHPVFLGLLLF